MIPLVIHLFLSLLFSVPPPTSSAHADTRSAELTLRSRMEQIRDIYDVKFVYDSSLHLDIPYTGKTTEGLSLEASLQELFRHSGFRWEVNGKYVVILPLRNFTLSGYVTLEDGETVINATVIDLTTGSGTLTNEHGFYSLTLPEGRHSVRFSFIGCKETIEHIALVRNVTRNVTLPSGEELAEVIVTADLNSPLSTTQTGKVTITDRDLQKEFALFSSPDVVKTLQNLPGVGAGTELISGLYVHGGANDENLFMLDGTPLYQVNHFGGIFSAFNTDVIKNIDFYKSGFPARYGGRLSSVVDVRTKEGNMMEHHGNFSLGLLDCRLQLEGPIRKGRTSYNFAIRRSWLDLLTMPLFDIRNSWADDEVNIRYAFHDLNAKVTHLFSDRSRADISIFWGDDEFRSYDKDSDDLPDGEKNNEYSKLNLQWGNFTTAINWKYIITSNLHTVLTGIYTRNRSSQRYFEENTISGDSTLSAISHNETNTWATIDNLGTRFEADYRPDNRHHIRGGINFLYHYFRPQSYFSRNFAGNHLSQDTITQSGFQSYRGQELSIYAEDDIALTNRLRLNLGIHYSLSHVPKKTYHSVEPRVALRYQLARGITMKASYTEMSQFMHQLTNSYLNLPMDYWVPSSYPISPARSRQYAAGVYLLLPHGIRFNLEGYYKSSRNLIEYDGGSSQTPAYEDWESRVRKGKGKAYGMETEAAYGTGRWEMTASYSLAWVRKKFPDFYPGWYPDKFDNRHKFNINLSLKISSGIDAYFAWNYRSGNRMTVPEHLVIAPIIPGIPDSSAPQWIYQQPNNISLPDYHRLDAGINFRSITRKGYERIWNISIYNAYCRMNPFFAKIEQRPDGSFTAKSTALFPIIPSFSYTLKF